MFKIGHITIHVYKAAQEFQNKVKTSGAKKLNDYLRVRLVGLIYVSFFKLVPTKFWKGALFLQMVKLNAHHEKCLA